MIIDLRVKLARPMTGVPRKANTFKNATQPVSGSEPNDNRSKLIQGRIRPKSVDSNSSREIDFTSQRRRLLSSKLEQNDKSQVRKFSSVPR